MSHRQERSRRGQVRGRPASSMTRGLYADKSGAVRRACHSVLERLEDRRLFAGIAGAFDDVRLIGITGNQESPPEEDETLYELNLLPGAPVPAGALDGFEDFSNPPDTVLSVSFQNGVTQGSSALRVDVPQRSGAYWGIRSGNVADLLRSGATQLSYDMTLIGRELNGGFAGTDNSFSGWAQGNDLAIAMNGGVGWVEFDSFAQGGIDSRGLGAQWAGQDGPRTISWDLTQLRPGGQSLAEHIAANNITEARLILVTQGSSGDVGDPPVAEPTQGPMRFYFDNIALAGDTVPSTVVADFDAPAITRLVKLPFVPDTDAIGFNPNTGLLHRTSGSTAYRDHAGRIGFQDNHFMETVDVNNPAYPQVGIFNATPDGERRGPGGDNPGVPTGPYGVPAPRPTWIEPTRRRLDTETDPAIGDLQGPGEYNAARDLVWSPTHNAFLVAADDGIWRLTADGSSSTQIGPGPGDDAKGIAFVTVGGQRQLFVSGKDTGNLYHIDPATGTVLNALSLVDPNDIPVPGILSLVEHPDGTLYGIGKSIDAPGDVDARELVRIDIDPEMTFGVVTYLGALGIHMADLAFVMPVTSGPTVSDVFVSGTAWSAPFLDELSEEGLGDANGFRILSGGAGDDELPWSNINRVSIKFSGAVNVDQADLRWASGVYDNPTDTLPARQQTYAVSAFAYNPTTFLASWTFDKPFANFGSANRQIAEKINVELNADGPDGVNIVGGDKRFRLNVVPGDANRSGATSAQDLGFVRSGAGRDTTPENEGTAPRNYTVFKDVNGSGDVGAQDVGVVRGNSGGDIANVSEPSGPSGLASIADELFSTVGILG
jgi:hypothetical protein